MSNSQARRLRRDRKRRQLKARKAARRQPNAVEEAFAELHLRISKLSEARCPIREELLTGLRSLMERYIRDGGAVDAAAMETSGVQR